MPVSGVQTDVHSDKGRSESARQEGKSSLRALSSKKIPNLRLRYPFYGPGPCSVDETLGLERRRLGRPGLLYFFPMLLIFPVFSLFFPLIAVILGRDH